MVTFVFSFCLCRFGFCVLCVCGSVDILVVKAKARVLRDLLVAKEGEVNRVRSSFSTFFSPLSVFTFCEASRGLWRKRWKRSMKVYVCLHSTLYAHFWGYFCLSFCFNKFCQFALFTFSTLTTSSTLSTHTHTHTALWKRLRKKWPRTPKIYTHLKLCVCVRFFLLYFFALVLAPFYENFWRDLILAPSQF